MADLMAIGIGHNQLFPVNSGAIRLKLKGPECTIWLVAKEEPYNTLYEIQLLNPDSSVTCCKNSATEYFHTSFPFNRVAFQEVWLSWYNGRIRIGSEREAPSIDFLASDKEYHNQIGYIQFYKPGSDGIDWEVEVSPHSVTRLQTKLIDIGKLHWVKMTAGGELPPDALIGGFENEPTYIARAYHNNSLCPGRYIPSKRVALIPWGHREHRKEQHYEILCGFDAIWMKTSSNNIPGNAFVAGTSEVRNEPLYIGRAMHDGNLITGKVHVLYKGCYLPYQGQEIMVGSYELLVLPNVTLRGR